MWLRYRSIRLAKGPPRPPTYSPITNGHVHPLPWSNISTSYIPRGLLLSWRGSIAPRRRFCSWKDMVDNKLAKIHENLDNWEEEQIQELIREAEENRSLWEKHWEEIESAPFYKKFQEALDKADHEASERWLKSIEGSITAKDVQRYREIQSQVEEETVEKFKIEFVKHMEELPEDQRNYYLSLAEDREEGEHLPEWANPESTLEEDVEFMRAITWKSDAEVRGEESEEEARAKIRKMLLWQDPHKYKKQGIDVDKELEGEDISDILEELNRDRQELLAETEGEEGVEEVEEEVEEEAGEETGRMEEEGEGEGGAVDSTGIEEGIEQSESQYEENMDLDIVDVDDDESPFFDEDLEEKPTTSKNS